MPRRRSKTRLRRSLPNCLQHDAPRWTATPVRNVRRWLSVAAYAETLGTGLQPPSRWGLPLGFNYQSKNRTKSVIKEVNVEN